MGGIEGVPTGPARCTLCGGGVVWRLTLGNRRIPLDAAPNPAGNVIVVEDGGRIRAQYLTGPEMPAQQEAFKVHKCPGDTRKRCRPCGFPMSPVLEELGYTTHVGCAPPIDLRAAVEHARQARKEAVWMSEATQQAPYVFGVPTETRKEAG